MIHGTYYFGRKRVACRNGYCTTCRAPQLAVGLRSVAVLHVYFIPTLPVGVTTRWFCTVCGKELDARQPSRPWILIAGAVFGLLMTFAGIVILVDGAARQTGIGMVVFAPLMVAGLVYMVRKQNYAGYIKGRAEVIPLSGERCPLCDDPLFPASTPHCSSCRVDILTR